MNDMFSQESGLCPQKRWRSAHRVSSPSSKVGTELEKVVSAVKARANPFEEGRAVALSLMEQSVRGDVRVSSSPVAAVSQFDTSAPHCAPERSEREEQSPPQPPDAPPNDEIYGQHTSRSSNEVFGHPFVQALLSAARARVSRGCSWVLCVRTYGRGGGDKGLRETTIRVLTEAGMTDYRDRVHVFVSHEDPDFTSGLYTEALGEWASRLVVGVKGADRQVRFIEECFCRGQHVVVCDDNLEWIKVLAGNLAWRRLRRSPCELAELFERAAAAMARYDAHLWSISATHNLLYMTKLDHTFKVSKQLALAYGALFGFICCHEEELYTHYGQIKDDVERSLRYWHRDRVILRFLCFACRKRDRPGFKAKKGGISSGMRPEAHRRQGLWALRSMVHGFARPYARLPVACDVRYAAGGPVLNRDGRPKWKVRVSNCGLVFTGAHTARHQRLVRDPGSALVAGYVCSGCRDPHSLGCSSCVNPCDHEALSAFIREVTAATMPTRGDTTVHDAALQEWGQLAVEQRLAYKDAATVQLQQTQWVSTKRRSQSAPKRGTKVARV